MSAPERIYLSGSTAVTRDRLTEKGLATAIEYIRADAPELVRLRRIAELAMQYRQGFLKPSNFYELDTLLQEYDSLLAAQHTEAQPRKTEDV